MLKKLLPAILILSTALTIQAHKVELRSVLLRSVTNSSNEAVLPNEKDLIKQCLREFVLLDIMRTQKTNHRKNLIYVQLKVNWFDSVDCSPISDI